MKNVPPANARPRAPINPPCCPPTEVPVCIWIAIDIQESSPDSAKTLSLGCMFSSRTGRTVPMILDSMNLSLMSVVRVDRPPARSLRRRVPRAIVADTHDQDLGAHRLESMSLLEVLLELAYQLLLDVHDATADLADRVVVVAARELVVGRSFAEVGRVHGA